MFKKLGIQITFITTIIIAVVVATLLVVSLTMFRQYNDDILVERAKVGVNVLENELDIKRSDLKRTFEILSEDAAFTQAIADKNEDDLKTVFERELDSNTYFMTATDSKGTTIYTSSAYPFKSFSISNPISGFVRADNELVLMEANKIGDSNVAIGFLVNSSGWMDAVKKVNDCDVTIFNDNLRYQTTLGSSMIGTAMGEAIKAKVIDNSQNYDGTATINNAPYYVAYTPLKDYNNKTVGAYFAGSNATDANNEFTAVTLISILIGAVGALGIATFLFIFCRKRVTQPLSEAEKYAVEMKAGQLDTTAVNFKFADDEVGRFVGVLKEAKQSMSDVVSDASGILTNMAQGDFTTAPSVEYPGVFVNIENSIAKISSDMGATLGTMNDSSNEVMSGAAQLAEGSQALADGTTRQASAIEEISATITDVSSQIARTAQNASDAGDLSKQTQDSVNQQDAEIQNMVAAMNEISNTSQEIEKIIKTIEDISFQTNILALNAAVEAARAGDAGKGFAVVADEVRNLANKSAEASASTAQLITASIEAVDKGSKIAESTAESMKNVKEMSARTAALISEIAIASQEQNDSIRQITAGIEQISQVIQTNSATAEETAASCEELSGQAKLLKDQIARFEV